MNLAEAKHICREEYISGFFISLRECFKDTKDNLGENGAYQAYDRCVLKLLDEITEARMHRFLSQYEFQRLMQTIRVWNDENEKILFGKDTGEDPILDSSKGDVFVNKADKGKQRSPEEFRERYKASGLFVPSNIDFLPTFSARKFFLAPSTIDLRDYCIRTRDQGKSPWCAAYAATSFASNVLWRKNDAPLAYDAEPIYKQAKTIDGSPHEDGTTLVAVLQALLNDKTFFDPTHCSVKVLRSIEQVKYAIHKFGCCLIGVMISREWYSCNKNKSTISGKKDTELLGGHAVLACGYTRDGIIIQNSWDIDWGSYGFALITWKEFEREFSYGAVIDNCLYDIKMN